jgi:hypothetical protein
VVSPIELCEHKLREGFLNDAAATLLGRFSHIATHYPNIGQSSEMLRRERETKFYGPGTDEGTSFRLLAPSMECRLESCQAEAIPALIELTKNGQFVRLRETWDLIYPGAKTFYGHGYIVDYDIDWISVRAGWVLENVTFQNFGFSEGVIDHDTMFKATLAGKADKPLQDVVKLQQDPSAQQRLRAAAAERAENWWKQKGADWDRHTALIEALTSQDPVRAERAMNRVRNGTTRCEGFNREFVKSRILAVTNNNLAAEMEEFRNWLVEMEKEKKDDFFYKSRSEDACY